jgi:hypothetical protein
VSWAKEDPKFDFSHKSHEDNDCVTVADSLAREVHLDRNRITSSNVAGEISLSCAILRTSCCPDNHITSFNIFSLNNREKVLCIII